MSFLELIVSTLWFFIPAYLANASPVLLSEFLKHPHSLDMNKKLKDGFPVLGKGKTVEGSIFGVIIGLISGFFMSLVQGELPITFLPSMSIEIGFLLGFGAIIGDIIASFFKRRFGYKRGEPFIFLDQLDFLVGAAVFSSFIFFDEYILFLGILITPIIHRAVNFIANLFHIKEVSW